jgi:hypothetical protein
MSKRLAAVGCGVLVVALAALFVAERRVEKEGRRSALPPEVLPSPNAFDDYKRAAALVDDKDLSDEGRGQTPADVALRRRLLAQNTEALRTLRAGFAHPCVEPFETVVWGPLPCDKYQFLGELLACEAAEHAARGEYAAALDRQLDAVRLGIDMGHGAGSTGTLVGAAVQFVVRDNVPVAPYIDHLDAPTALAAARRLAAILATESRPADTLRVERETAPAMLGTGSRRADRDGNGRRPSVRERWDYYWTFRQCNLYLDAAIAWAATAEPGAMPVAPAPDLARYGHEAQSMTTDALSLLRKVCILRAANEMLLTALALQAWHAEHGRYPDTLVALVPGLLETLPRDPFSSGPLKYRLEGDKYVLYSVGPDGKDDGGRPAENAAPKGGQTRYLVLPNSVGDHVWGISLP